jgi:uncharacterized protein (DUF608 family)
MSDPSSLNDSSWITKPEILFQKGKEKIYLASKHKKAAMPLGGIGIGSIMLHSSGTMIDWRIFGNIATVAENLPGTFFAVRTEIEQKVTIRTLQTKPVGEFEPVKEIEFIGEFPLAKLRYIDEELPIQVKLQAFTSFVPLNERISATPSIIFQFHIHNPSKTENARISLLMSCQNAVGYNGRSRINGVHCYNYGGNINELFKKNGLTGILMRYAPIASSVQSFDPYDGTITIATDNAATTTNWQSLNEIYKDFKHKGAFKNNLEIKPSKQGSTWNGALTRAIDLPPDGEAEVLFYLSWHFPNRLTDNQRGHYRIGNRYNVWFSNAKEVCEYIHGNIESIRKDVMEFHKAFYGSTIPQWLLELIGSQLAVLVSPTAIWTENGNFGLWEGVNGASQGGCKLTAGCCGINCMHVLNYEMSLAMLFPKLERIIRQLEVDYHRRDDGAYTDKMYNGFPPDRPVRDNIDNSIGFPLKVYRDYLWTGDKTFLELMWPRVKEVLRWLIERDLDDDGIPNMRKEKGSTKTYETTYDNWTLYGTSSFIGSYWLTALLSCEQMAYAIGEKKLAKKYRKLFEKSSENFENELWNSEYYNLFYDPEYDYERLGDYYRCCMSDQVIGQWWAHIIDVGYILPREHVRKALAAVLNHNWFEDYEYESGVYGPKLSIYTYPYGERRSYKGFEKPGEALWHGEYNFEGRVCYRNWTGSEIGVAAHNIYEDMLKEGLMIARGLYDRYDGIRANPWRHNECGSFYSRGLSSWSIILALSGFHCNVDLGSFEFSPKLTPEQFKCWFGCGKGWGIFRQYRSKSEQINKIYISSGEIKINQLKLNIPEKQISKVIVHKDNQKIISETEFKGETLILKFPTSINLSSGDSIQIRCN